MSTSKQELDDFYKFASSYMEGDEADLTMDELCHLWQAEKPTPEEYADCVAALKEAIADMEAGDRGEPVEEALREIHDRLGLVIEE